MAHYVVEKIENGIATIRYSDNSWAQIIITENMTEEQLDQEAWNFRPKRGSSQNTNIVAGSSRKAKPSTISVQDSSVTLALPQWLKNRQDAYGTLESQIEFITENGLEAWQAEVAEIKRKNPKPSE